MEYMFANKTMELVLPQAFKLLPLYSLCWTKNKTIKGGFVAADVRQYHAFKAAMYSVRDIIQQLYPKLCELHSATSPNMSVLWTRATHRSIKPDGIYLIGQMLSSAFLSP
jgi:protein transport protein SEC24